MDKQKRFDSGVYRITKKPTKEIVVPNCANCPAVTFYQRTEVGCGMFGGPEEIDYVEMETRVHNDCPLKKENFLLKFDDFPDY